MPSRKCFSSLAVAGACLLVPSAVRAQDAPVLWNPSQPDAWSYRYSLTSGPAQGTAAHGGTGDVPIMGDFDGDGFDELGIVRRGANGNWTWYMSGTNTGYQDDPSAGFTRTPFEHGSPDGPYFDIPVVGDWNGDGIDTAGLVRRAGNGNMQWILTNNEQAAGSEIPFFEHGCSDSATCGAFDVPIVGDWNGDGIDTANLIRRDANGNKNWILTNNQYAGGVDAGQIAHGSYDPALDLSAIGDWDGDGDDSIGIFRRAEQRWYLWSALTTPNDIQFVFGTGEETAAFGAALVPEPSAALVVALAGLGFGLRRRRRR